MRDNNTNNGAAMDTMLTHIKKQIVEHTGQDQTNLVNLFVETRTADEIQGLAGFFNYINGHPHTMTKTDIKIKIICFLTWARTPSAPTGTLEYLAYAV